MMFLSVHLAGQVRHLKWNTRTVVVKTYFRNTWAVADVGKTSICVVEVSLGVCSGQLLLILSSTLMASDMTLKDAWDSSDTRHALTMAGWSPVPVREHCVHISFTCLPAAAMFFLLSRPDQPAKSSTAFNTNCQIVEDILQNYEQQSRSNESNFAEDILNYYPKFTGLWVSHFKIGWLNFSSITRETDDKSLKLLARHEFKPWTLALQAIHFTNSDSPLLLLSISRSNRNSTHSKTWVLKFNVQVSNNADYEAELDSINYV